MYFTLSADGDKACQDPFPGIHGGSRADLLTRTSSYNVKGWNGKDQFVLNVRGGWWLFWFSCSSPQCECRSIVLETGLSSKQLHEGVSLLKVQCVLWAFVSRWDNVGLISCLAGTNNSLGEMLRGLINNNAVIHYILISKFIPAEKLNFTLSIRTGGWAS